MITIEDVKAAQRSGNREEASRVAKAYNDQQNAPQWATAHAAAQKRNEVYRQRSEAAAQMRETAHDCAWQEMSVSAGNSMNGDNYLLKVRYYCTTCHAIKVSTQSASTCEWRETLPNERVILDDDGVTPLGTAGC